MTQENHTPDNTIQPATDATGTTAQGAQPLGTQEAEAVGGGESLGCSITTITGQLTQAYEDLVDTASHVMERVSKAL